MKLTNTLCGLAAAVALIALPGCAVTRDQQSMGAYIDDATITAQVKAKLAEDTKVDAAAISVETMNGTVQLSGFAKSAAEKAAAENAARTIDGVKSVKNSVIVRN